MKNTLILLTPLLALGTGCSTMQPSTMIASADLPSCFASNYSEQYKLFTVVNPTAKAVNQQCLLTVLPRGNNSAGPHLVAGNYLVSVSNGGGGGAGGTMQSGSKLPGVNNSGGGGGGGAGAAETKASINLTEGTYRLTIGVGGPGGMACSGPPDYFPGGPGWGGSPTNIVRIATGEVILGAAGAETYARQSRSQHERSAGVPDGKGGSGPGMTTGGDGATFSDAGKLVHPASDGMDKQSTSAAVARVEPGKVQPKNPAAGPAGAVPSNSGASSTVSGGDSGKVLPKDQLAGPGGGGGASSVGVGGTGGGDLPKNVAIVPTRGTLGSGGGGGAGDTYGCAAGANGGHGFVAFVKT